MSKETSLNMTIRLLLLACFYGVVASSNETTTITTKTTSTSLTIVKDETKAVNKTSPSAVPDVTTLPNLPEVGEVKSRRKPTLKDQEGSDVKQKDKKDMATETTDTKVMNLKKDENSTLLITPKKGAPKKSFHGKKEIRNYEENDQDENKLKTELKNLKTNVTSMPHNILPKVNNVATLDPSSGILPESTTEYKMKIGGKTKVSQRDTTETPFKVHSSVVKIVPLKQDTKLVSKTTTPKSALQHVELPNSVSVGLNTAPSPISPSENKLPSEKEKIPEDERNGSAGLIVGLFFGMVLTAVLVFVGLKRLDAIRRRREYRRMNDFLIDGMYNDA